MKIFAAFFGLVALASAQSALIEDFACTMISSISNANPAIVTCPGPHHFNQAAYLILTISTTTNAANGDTVSANGIVYTFVAAMDNSQPRKVLIGNSAADTAANLAHAVNDDGTDKGTVYSTP